MKRHPGLVPFSHDHQHGLAAALRLRRAAASGGEALLRESGRFLRFAERELAAHLQDEEAELLPLLAGADRDFAPDIERLTTEHARIRQLVAQLDAARRAAAATAADGANALASSSALAASAAAAAELLHDHIRWEERELFEHAQQQLTELDLARLAQALSPRAT